MLKADELTSSNIKKELNRVSGEMITLIRKYNLEATSPLDVITVAKKKISSQADYIRFLELSLEGRILGDAGDAIEKAEAEFAEKSSPEIQ